MYHDLNQIIGGVACIGILQFVYLYVLLINRSEVFIRGCVFLH